MSGGVRGIDEEVIHIDEKPSFHNEISEQVVHEPLEHGRGIHESKEHNHGFEKPFVGNKGSFPLVSVFDLDIVVSPADVELGENFCSFELVHEIGDKGEGVGILNSMFI